MPFVTSLKLQSGDRHLLEDVVTDIKTRAERKGVELKGPHALPSTDVRVPQVKRLSDGDAGGFEPWGYTVYCRSLSIHGHDEFARDVAGDEYPPGIHVEAEVERVRASGSS
jgi:ribosomal protein S10